MTEPKTLLEAIQYFSDPENCRSFMVSVRWADEKVRCPKCGNENVSYLEKAKLYFCPVKHPKQKFSLKVGTIFEDSPIKLEKWLPAAWLIANSRNGISSYELARSLGVTQKSAWHMLHRLRHAMAPFIDLPKIGGPGTKPIEADESMLGGRIANMHRKKVRAMRSALAKDKSDGYEVRYDNKTPVMGLYDRESREVRAKVIPNIKRDTLMGEILSNIEHGSKVYTDSARAYDLLRYQSYIHESVNHAERYVDGQVHTNSLENFWSLVKRNLRGTYVAVEPFHLQKYLDETIFRFNSRHTKDDAGRFKKLLSQIVGKRLTYAELTGKEAGSEAF